MDAIKPQPGPQEKFLSSAADIAIYGGAAGGGKSFALLMEPLRHSRGLFYVEHVERFQGSAHEVERSIRTLAENDGKQVGIALPQDPGQAGKAQAQSLARLLAGYRLTSVPVTGAKEVRAHPFAAQAEAGNVMLLAGPWNEAFLTELEAFPAGRHDDQVDAVCEAFNTLTDQPRNHQQDMYA
jgi:predicted phage terminase large subunit-like protein